MNGREDPQQTAWRDGYAEGYEDGCADGYQSGYDAALEDTRAVFDPVTLAEDGRRLASQRDDLIAQGADPAELQIPIHPGDEQ